MALPWLLRCYVGAVPLAALVLIGVTAAADNLARPADLVKFLVLLGCG